MITLKVFKLCLEPTYFFISLLVFLLHRSHIFLQQLIRGLETGMAAVRRITAGLRLMIG